ncbi:hypothetical protein HC891_11360 [Candidatus Gracilibacteria bacterium]|nr:hypothetical protein [Candidatus Gracilibacteria bacterium]
MIGYFAAHPAAWQWRIGDGLQRIAQAENAIAARDWWAKQAELARSLGASQIAASHDAFNLSRTDSARPAALAAEAITTLINVRPDLPLRLRRPWSADYVLALYALLSGLLAAERSSYRPPIVSGIGLATADQQRWQMGEQYGELLNQYYGDSEVQSNFLVEAIGGLHRAGAGGAWLALFADPPRSLWRAAPLDRSQPWRRLGLVGDDGHQKPAAAMVKQAIATIRANGSRIAGSPSVLDLDPERYWHDPGATLQRLIDG